MTHIRRLIAALCLLMAAFAGNFQAALAAQHAGQLSEGEIRRIDKDAGKMTIRHGPLENLDMPAMSMVFVAGDRAMLDQVKVGDKIRFRAEKIGSQYTVTKIEPAQ